MKKLRTLDYLFLLGFLSIGIILYNHRSNIQTLYKTDEFCLTVDSTIIDQSNKTADLLITISKKVFVLYNFDNWMIDTVFYKEFKKHPHKDFK